jgi:hypothetical protein
MLHQNQYGFIKGKTIHDFLAWTYEYFHICHLSKKPIIILKIYFEKAFDKVEYNAIIAMCSALGFGPKFLSWIKHILYIASTSVLLNGVPAKKLYVSVVSDKEIHHHHYYLSPLLKYYSMSLMKLGRMELSTSPLIMFLDRNSLSYNTLMTL